MLTSSPELDPAALPFALPARDGLRVTLVEGVGVVAAQRRGDFTHVVAGLDGVHAIDLTPWDDEPADAFGELEARPVDLAFLADTPAGVATRLLDAALSGPVVFYEPEEARRREWIAWLTYALPGGAAVTFSTAGDEHAHLRAVPAGADAIDATAACDLAPSLYARVALELAARGDLRAAVAQLQEPDAVALAVHGGATDLLAPHQLPLALQLITELATSGRVREAARAAAALPVGGAGTALVVHEPRPAPELAAPDPPPAEEIQEAEVVEEEPLPDVDAWSSLLAELQTESVEPLPDVQAPPEEVEVVEEELGISLAELEQSLKRERPQ